MTGFGTHVGQQHDSRDGFLPHASYEKVDAEDGFSMEIPTPMGDQPR